MGNTDLDKNTEYNYGIGLFRIISMFMVLILHILGHGSIWDATDALTVNHETAWLLAVGAYCAVNSYALISGYVGYGKRHKYSKLLYLYLQVIFYTLITTAVFYVYRPELIGPQALFHAAFPFAFNTYWYFTAYFCLFFFMPFYNLMLDTFDRAVMKKMLVTMFVVFSVLPVLFQSDFPFTGNGFSFLWLSVLYIAGAYMKKYAGALSYNNKKNLLGYFFCVILTWMSKIVIEFVNFKKTGTPGDGNYLISYVSPTIVSCSVFLLLFFSRLDCREGLKRLIRFFVPVSFGIYLFHEEPLIREAFIVGAFRHYIELNPFLMVLAVLITALVIGFAGALIDRVRLEIFNILKVKQHCGNIERYIESLCQEGK